MAVWPNTQPRIIVAVKQVDDTIAEGEQEGKKDLVYYQDSDGMWIIHARLPAEAGSLVVKAIEAVATPEQEKNQTKNTNWCSQHPQAATSKAVSFRSLKTIPRNRFPTSSTP